MNAKELKDSILQYAMQGKLVPQDPNDEPASELVKNIKAEKELLVLQKQTKKEKALPIVKADEIPFDIPNSWEWVRINELYYNLGQKTPEDTFTYIDVASINNIRGVLSEGIKVLDPKDAPSRARKIVGLGDVIYSTVRPYLKNIAIVDKVFEYETIASTAFIVLKPYNKVLNEYLYFVLNSPMFDKQVSAKVQGVTYPAINDKNFNSLVVPLPPFEEQKRITIKIKELMAVTEIYDEKNQQLKKLKNKFPSQLETSILQYAMQGKLVEQLETDESASLLVERIKAEKARLVKEKLIKKEKALAEITENEIPFDIPSSWEWTRILDVCLVNPRNDASDEMDAAFIPMKLIDDGFVNKHDFEMMKWGDIKKGFTHFQSGDVVVAKITPCFENRKSAVLVDLPNDFGAGTTELYVIRPIGNMIYNEFLLWLFKTHHFISNGVASYTGTAGQQRVSKLFIENYLIPLPPYEEQLRIVDAIKKMNVQLDYLSKG